MRPLHMLFGALVAVFWGGNFVAAKYSLGYFPPFYVTALRFVLVALLMLPFVARPGRAQLRSILPMSALSTLHFSLLFMSLGMGMDISTSALVGQLGVPFACLLGVMFLGDRLGPWRIGGIVVAFIGIAIVAGTPNILSHPAAFGIAVASSFFWAIANILIKRLTGWGPMQMLAWMSVCVVPMLLLLALLLESPLPPLADAPAEALLGLLYTAVFSTIVAYGLWYYLLSRYTVSQVTPYSLLTPVFGIAFGQLFFTEQLTPAVLLGGALTILGVAIIVIRRPKTLEQGSAT